MRRVYVYDLETFKNFFCAVFVDKDTNDKRSFEISYRKNELNELILFLKNEVNGLIGYNVINFDGVIIEYILKGVLKTAEEIHKKANQIIDEETALIKEWEFSIPHLDPYKILHLDNKNRRVGLKWCEFMMDWHNIEDIPLDPTTPIYDDVLANVVLSYCENDVLATKKLYESISKEINLRKDLIKKYNIKSFLNASNSKIGSDLMLKLYCTATGKKASDVKYLRTVRSEVLGKDVIFNYIDFKTPEFNTVLNWFKNKSFSTAKDNNSEFISSTYKGFRFDYGKGGIHGSVDNTIVIADDGYIIKDADVALTVAQLKLLKLTGTSLELILLTLHGDIVKGRA